MHRESTSPDLCIKPLATKDLFGSCFKKPDRTSVELIVSVKAGIGKLHIEAHEVVALIIGCTGPIVTILSHGEHIPFRMYCFHRQGKHAARPYPYLGPRKSWS